MRKPAKVLAFGPEEWIHAVRQALPGRQKNSFIDVKSLCAMCSLPETVCVDVAVLHHSLAPNDLRYAAEYIRRRWQNALIIVIGDHAKQLDDPLYDDWASCTISPEELMCLIEKLITARERNSSNLRPRLGDDGR